MNDIILHNLDIALEMLGDNTCNIIIESYMNLDDVDTPEELLDWMSYNINYSEYTKLQSINDFLKTKSGSCLDQVYFEYKYLKKCGVSPKILFFIAHKPNGSGLGMMHTLCYYEKDNGIYWFENSWDTAKGLRKYKDLNALKIDIFHRYRKLSDFRKFPELEFKSISITKFKPGMDLEEFVSGIMD